MKAYNIASNNLNCIKMIQICCAAEIEFNFLEIEQIYFHFASYRMDFLLDLKTKRFARL